MTVRFLATLNPEKFGYILDALQQSHRKFTGRSDVDLEILRSTCEKVLDSEVRKLTARIDLVSRHGQEWGLTTEYRDEWAKQRERFSEIKAELSKVLREDGKHFDSVLSAG